VVTPSSVAKTKSNMAAHLQTSPLYNATNIIYEVKRLNGEVAFTNFIIQKA